MFEGLFQPMHQLVVFGIALLVFEPKKLPELGTVQGGHPRPQDSNAGRGKTRRDSTPCRKQKLIRRKGGLRHGTLGFCDGRSRRTCSAHKDEPSRLNGLFPCCRR
jgi:hypothetical protein